MVEAGEDNFLERVIVGLVILVGILLLFNQFQLVKLSAGIALNSMAFLLFLVLTVLTVWLFFNHEKKHEKHAIMIKRPLSLLEKTSYGIMIFISALIIFNQFQISQVNAILTGGTSPVNSFVKSVSSNLRLGSAESGKEGIIIGPQLNTDGRTTKLVEWKTISETPAVKSTGNPTQDAINAVVPRGMPFYVTGGDGSERIQGVSFDDPIKSQNVWASLLGSKRFGTANAIQLSPEEDARWKKITSAFTCDFCCGGPNSVTTINHCGCAHSYAWQGMAKFFIKYYPAYSDEQVMGEMTKWKGLWYPKGMIQDFLVYNGQQDASTLTHGGSVGIKQQFLQRGSNSGQPTKAEATPISDLPSMVGGC